QSLLNRITVPTPCAADGNQMQGDERRRFCASCGKHVYSFAEMTTQEAIALLREKGWNLCCRLYKRPDGTVITADCHHENSRKRGPWQFTLRSIIAVVAGFAAILGLGRLVAKCLNCPQVSASKSDTTINFVTKGVIVDELDADDI